MKQQRLFTVQHNIVHSCGCSTTLFTVGSTTLFTGYSTTLFTGCSTTLFTGYSTASFTPVDNLQQVVRFYTCIIVFFCFTVGQHRSAQSRRSLQSTVMCGAQELLCGRCSRMGNDHMRKLSSIMHPRFVPNIYFLRDRIRSSIGPLGN